MYGVLRELLGLRDWPYLLPVLVLHLVAAHLLWRLMIRLQDDPWVATAVVAVFAMAGAGYENIVWAFQIAFVRSTLRPCLGPDGRWRRPAPAAASRWLCRAVNHQPGHLGPGHGLAGDLWTAPRAEVRGATGGRHVCASVVDLSRVEHLVRVGDGRQVDQRLAVRHDHAEFAVLALPQRDIGSSGSIPRRPSGVRYWVPSWL